jgi:hypothetical protein
VTGLVYILHIRIRCLREGRGRKGRKERKEGRKEGKGKEGKKRVSDKENRKRPQGREGGREEGERAKITNEREPQEREDVDSTPERKKERAKERGMWIARRGSVCSLLPSHCIVRLTSGMVDFNGAIVVITGAGSGIGRELSKDAAKAGAQSLALCDVNMPGLEETKRIVESMSSSTLVTG